MADRQSKRRNGAPGLAVDAQGGAVVDPTQNVLDLSEASNRRQDDLREANNKLYDARIDALEKMATITSAHANELREAEVARVNAIRQVDVLAVNTAADRASAAIQALAATTASNAETLRAMVANTATTIATQLQQTVSSINERIGMLEKSSYTGAGKQALSDPMMTELVSEMKAMRLAQSTSAGKGEGLHMGWGILLGAITAASTLYAMLK